MRLERSLGVAGQLRVGARTSCGVRRPPREKAIVAGSLGGLALFLGVPLAALVERSLAVGDGYWLAGDTAR